MRQPPREQPTQEVRPPRLIVHVSDHGVLDGDAPSRARRVVPRSLKHFGDLPALVYRYKFVAKVIIGRVQRKRKGQAQILGGQSVHGGHQPDC